MSRATAASRAISARIALSASLAICAAGCGVPLEAPSGAQPVNTCQGDGDCAEGASCTAGVCAATRYDLAGALLEVRPDGAAVFGGGLSFVVDPAAAGVPLVSSRSGAQPFFSRFDVHLAAPVALQGNVVPDPSTALGAGCTLPKGTLPASLTFYRLPRLSSLPFDPVKVSTSQADPGSENVFTVQLVSDPADRYDVYIQPQPVAGCPTFPPYFVPNQTIDASSTVWKLPPFGALTGNIAGLTDDDLGTWLVDVVEPTRGLPISTASSLMLAVGTLGAALSAAISPVPGGQSPIVRLTPIAPTAADAQAVDATRPTVYWTLEGAISAGTLANPVVHLAVDDMAIAPVMVSGQILGSDGLAPIPSQLTLQSGLLNGTDAGNASYSNDTVVTDQQGVFTVALPPGDYTIRAVPLADDGLSITDIPLTWPVNMATTACVCGLTFDLKGKPALAGTVTTPNGMPLSGTTVGVSPSLAPPRSYLANTHSLPPLPARAETTTTDGSGAFNLLVDQATSDLTVQPDPSTNLPWLVIPQLTPVTGMASLPRALTTPAFLGGTVLDPQGMPVANAEIDVWFPVRDPANPAVLTGAVVKIATTTTDVNGAYTLVLPSSI